MTCRRLATLTLGALGASAVAAGAQPRRAESAPITDVRYDLRFDRALAARRTVHVVMTFVAGARAPVLLAFPVWTPGAYEVVDYARYVSAFSATAGARVLAWEKTDPSTWRVHPEGTGPVSVGFDVLADTLDNGMDWARPDFLLLNGATVFPYPVGRPLDAYPATVTIHTEPDWRVVTGMTPTRPRDGWTAASYHDLVDMPFFVGRFDLDSEIVVGRPLRLATYPAGVVSGARRASALRALARVVPPEAEVFGDVPWTDYTVLEIADSAYAGASGLEHQSSHVDVIAAAGLDDPFVPSLYAHEIFHAWNVKRLRPAEMVPYRYDAPQPTPWLWVSEGVTDYYADLAELRGGVVDTAGFLALTSGKIDEVAAAPPVSLADASISTWVRPTDGSALIYYAKGSLAGLLLDVLIRDASDGRHSLDDVLRALYDADYHQGRGFTGEQWWSTVSRIADGRRFDDFARRFVEGREPFPYDSVLPLAGLRLLADTARQAQLGVLTDTDSDGVRVTAVEEGSAADAAGIREGDYLVALGDLPVQDAGFGVRFRAKYAHATGRRIPVRVRRDGRELTLVADVRFVDKVSHRVVLDAHPSPRAARLRAALLRAAGA